MMTKEGINCWHSSSELKKHIFSCLEELNIKPSKSRGQNYLIDANIIRYQIEKADVQKSDIVLEIGGGPGTLTKCLASKAKQVYTIEYDKAFAAYLKDYFSSYSNVEVIMGDAIKVEWPHFTKCVSNLPYQISSPVTFKLLKHDFNSATLMYQKEFAKRMVAKPNTKNYSRLSIMINLLAECEYHRTVSEYSFYPQPKIQSALISLRPKREKYDFNFEEFSNFVTVLFTMKGKTVRSILRKQIKRRGEIEENKYALLDQLPYIKRRIFTLHSSELIELYKEFKEKIGWFAT
ncbi:MAG: 16S rRNA (adenine(1518)-N(6)/adenine(1519)-N(6))-dimethyltransferase RsmA [Candidatus Heimdallarchaeaceae archaeon]